MYSGDIVLVATSLKLITVKSLIYTEIKAGSKHGELMKSDTMHDQSRQLYDFC